VATAFRVRYRSLDAAVHGERLLYQLPIRIGRNPLNQCQIAHAYVSDFHVAVEAVDGRPCVRDLRSKNGVFSTTGGRLPADVPVPLATTGYMFLLSGFVHVQVEVLENQASAGDRFSETRGAVLGNREFLEGRPPPQLPVGPSTQQFTMAPEALALTGLRELGASLAPGVPLQTAGDVARLVTKLHDTIEVFCRCFVPVRDAAAQLGPSPANPNRAASPRAVHRSAAAARIESARDPAAVAAALLDWRNQDYDGPNAIEGVFAELLESITHLLEYMTHQGKTGPG
jgi:hypothetical protein